MRKPWWKWYWMSKILVGGGGDARTSRTFYTVVVKSVLFFWLRDVGDDPMYWTNPGGVPPQVGPMADDTVITADRKSVVITV